jgi:hypothetical protein
MGDRRQGKGRGDGGRGFEVWIWKEGPLKEGKRWSFDIYATYIVQ